MLMYYIFLVVCNLYFPVSLGCFLIIMVFILVWSNLYGFFIVVHGGICFILFVLGNLPLSWGSSPSLYSVWNNLFPLHGIIFDSPGFLCVAEVRYNSMFYLITICFIHWTRLSSFGLLLLCMCVVCMYICLHECSSLCVCTCVHMPRETRSYCWLSSLITLNPVCWDRVSHSV